MNEKRRIAGIRSKIMGMAWENLFESNAWRFGAAVIKIPDGCRQVSKGKLIRVKSPFDFVIIKSGKSVFLDTKTTLGTRWTYSDCDRHQMYWLEHCAKAGSRAGYMVEFRALRRIVFFSIERLSRLQPRESLSPDDGLQISSDDDRLDLGRLFYERRTEEATPAPGT